MKIKQTLQPFFIFFILLAGLQHVHAQTLIQFDSTKTIQFGKFGKDSLTVVLQIKKGRELFPMSYFIKGRLVGNNTLEINIPDSLNVKNSSWSFSEYIATADNSNMYIRAQEYAAFAYRPFDYDFKTTPPNASIYIVPLPDWKTLFNREDINFVLKDTDLPLLAEYKILMPSPCNYTLFEQRYIGVFVLNDKIKMEIIKPKRNDPSHNKADIIFN